MGRTTEQGLNRTGVRGVAEEAEDLTEAAIDLAGRWLRESRRDLRWSERRVIRRLSSMVGDPANVSFTMQFVDRVARHRDDAAAAHELRSLVRGHVLPGYLAPHDRLLLRVGGVLAPVLPHVVMPLARRRLRMLVGHMVVDAEPGPMHDNLESARAEGFDVNVNLLGEMVLGEAEAQRRFQHTLDLIDDPHVDYVSVKVSAIASQLDLWSFDDTVDRLRARMRSLFRRAAAGPGTFINLDMEEYRDLELTIAAFTSVLDEPELADLDAGIVLQAYLPDSFDALRRLADWSAARHRSGGGTVKIRLVKGANLAMEKVDAAMHGWQQAPYPTKADVDACYKKCLDWVLRTEHMQGLRVGVASHNLFDMAWALLLARRRGVADRVEMEMLTGIAPAQARAVRADAGGLRLYTPIVSSRDFDIAIAYLFRRLEENTAPSNFLSHLWTLEPGSAEFRRQADQFRASVRDRDRVSVQTRRGPESLPADAGFGNAPDTDPALPSTQDWLAGVRRLTPTSVRADLATSSAPVRDALAAARRAQPAWAALPATDRRDVLLGVADAIGSRRDVLLTAIAHEGRKTYAEADPEITEAVDFARWYAECALAIDALRSSEGLTFTPHGVVAVVPPWNFPVAIPAGGVLAALAAGNAVVLKPSLETPRCAEIIAEACWAAGVPRELLHFLRTPDDDLGRQLVTEADAVILTGSWLTANLFRSWRPDMRLLGETSGKNALVITPSADVDLAAADLVRSAFGHSGQKCSAASLAILVGPLAENQRFIDKVLDTAASLRLGWPPTQGVTMGPVISRPTEKLHRALTTLDAGERWLLEPRPVDDSGELWSPGIKTGVAPGSEFHQTEYFGPVLGIMRARDLDEAIAWQNAVPYGLTGGIHTLDPSEVERWLARVEVGNAYVNRHITGAIVRRQPFGGWKRSSVGLGAKPGGPDYLLQLGVWRDAAEPASNRQAAARRSDQHWWDSYYSKAHDPTALFCEQNLLRYLPYPDVSVWVAADGGLADARRTIRAARTVGVEPIVSAVRQDVAAALGGCVETEAALITRLGQRPFGRVRCVGQVSRDLRLAAVTAESVIVDDPVVTSGRLELRWYLREQAISRTLHRFGNLITEPPQR